MKERTGRAFIVSPFGSKKNSMGEDPIDFGRVHRELIGKALDQLNLAGGTTEEFIEQGNIRTDMFRQLLAADLVVADISIHNANAFYELGIRHALRDQYTVLIKSDKRGDPHVFDLKADRYLAYDPDNPAASIKKLVATIKATLEKESSDSPVFELLPGLTSFDPSKVVVVPLKFREKVKQLADNREALLALFHEISGEAWETEAFRIIGAAQFALGDHEESIKIWERIREFDMFDFEANQRLATCFQKLGKYTLSEQAADRALQSPRLSDWDRAEVYSLIASNRKTQWHTELKTESDLVRRQHKALASPLLQESYESYRKGFEQHRSHYYSGLNAVAMLSIQVELAKLHPDRWILEFRKEKRAEVELEERTEYLGKLIAATDLSIESSIENYPEDDWAKLSRADLMLLASKSPTKVKRDYERCANVPAFNASSLKRQLEIYQDLELFGDNVNAALESVADD
jgi:tetratricopeptide (TPR) repeat protein